MSTFKRYSGFSAWFAALLLVALAAGCGGGGGSSSDQGRDPILGKDSGVVGTAACVPGVIAKDITAYTFPTSTATVIDQVLKTIAVTVPNGTNVTALVATFTTTGTGATVSTMAQTSGTTANNFTNPVVYTVAAGDCSTVNYTVTVTVAPAAPVASCAVPGSPVDLGLATSFGVLVGPAGGATLTVTNPTSVTGDVGAASYVPATGPSTVVGTQYTGVDAPYVAAKAAMLTAIACAAGRACTANYGVATDFATVVGLAPGVHCVTGAMSVGSNMVLNNPGVYIFKSSGALTSANNISLTFGAGVNDTNTQLFWVPTGAASIGSGNTFKGTIMPDASAATTLGATTTLLPGRAFSNSAVNLDTNQIAIP